MSQVQWWFINLLQNASGAKMANFVFQRKKFRKERIRYITIVLKS